MDGSSIPDLAEWRLFQQGRDDVIGKEVVITRVRNRRLSVSVSGAPRCPQLLLPRRHGCCCCSDCACSSSSLLWTLAPRDRFPPREVAFYLLYQSLRPQKKKKTWGKLFSYSSPFIALLFALCSFVRLALSLSLSLSLLSFVFDGRLFCIHRILPSEFFCFLPSVLVCTESKKPRHCGRL